MHKFLSRESLSQSFNKSVSKVTASTTSLVHLRLAIERKNIFIYYFFPNIHTSVNITSKNHYVLIVKCIYNWSCDKRFWDDKF